MLSPSARAARPYRARAQAVHADRSRPANLRAKFVWLWSSLTGKRWQCRRRKIEESKASTEALLCREERLERSLMGISKVTPTFRWRLFMLSRRLRVLSHSSVTFTQSRHLRGFKGKAVSISFINPAALNGYAYLHPAILNPYVLLNMRGMILVVVPDLYHRHVKLFMLVHFPFLQRMLCQHWWQSDSPYLCTGCFAIPPTPPVGKNCREALEFVYVKHVKGLPELSGLRPKNPGVMCWEAA